MKKLLAITLLFVTVTAQAHHLLEDLGLAWGQTAQTLRAKNYQLDNCSTKQDITACDVTHHIEGPAQEVMYILFFDKHDGLQKLQMPINYISDDATGEKGKGLYKQLKESLIERDGESVSYEYTGKKRYTGDKEFYQCLHYDGCGAWVSFWNRTDGDVTYITLTGVEEGTGYLVLYYESKRWQELVEAM